MPNRSIAIDDGVPALQIEFDNELKRLACRAGRNGRSQGVMRLRALVEIVSALSTEALMDLAVAVRVTNQETPAGDSLRA